MVQVAYGVYLLRKPGFVNAIIQSDAYFNGLERLTWSTQR